MPARFILIGNYPPDRQESMLRFAEMLGNGLRAGGCEVENIAPQAKWVGPNSHPGGGLAKWLAYVDKWILFPRHLRRWLQQEERKSGARNFYHVCDHSNAPYLACLPPPRAGITCHDVLAIRGALGHADAYCPASRTGVVLQKWILKHLAAAERVACVSEFTRQQLCELAGRPTPKPGWIVAHNALNADFGPMERGAARALLERQGIGSTKPFLLHVGSNLPRKNRGLLLEMMRASRAWTGDVCFAGEPADERLQARARELGLAERMKSVAKPDHDTLRALYALAEALVFPSLAEGFGWPVIEAQSSGTPVLASSLAPMPEVSGGAALHADPRKPEQFVSALDALQAPGKRQTLIAEGLKNAKKFGLQDMIDKYLKLYGVSAEIAAPAR